MTVKLTNVIQEHTSGGTQPREGRKGREKWGERKERRREGGKDKDEEEKRQREKR